MGGDPVDVFKNNDFYWNDDFAVDEHSNEPVEPIKHYAMLMYDSRDQNSTVDGSIRPFSRVPHFSSAEPSINDTEDEDEDDGGTREYGPMNFTFRRDAEVGRTLYHDNFDHKPSRTHRTQHFLVCGGTLFGGRVVAQGWPPCSVGGLTGLCGSCLVQKTRGWGRVWAATRQTGRDRTKKLDWL